MELLPVPGNVALFQRQLLKGGEREGEGMEKGAGGGGEDGGRGEGGREGKDKHGQNSKVSLVRGSNEQSSR